MIPMTEPNVEEIIGKINDDMRVIVQKGVADMSQREYEEYIGGGRVARIGAWVLSIEGESWREGLNAVEGRCKLGRFVKSEEFNDMIKITFTKPNGLYVGNSDVLLPPERRVPHPLSREGYYVPREGGYLTLEDGYIILVSRSGVLSGRGAWPKVRELHEKWVHEVNNNHSLLDRIAGLTTQLKHTEDQMMIMSASREDFQLWAQDKELRFRNAYDTLGRLRNQISSLTSQLQGLQWTGAHQEQTIKKTLSDIDILAREVRTYVQDEKMFDVLREASTKFPDISPYRESSFKDRIKRTGLLREDPMEKLIEEQKKMIAELQRRLSEKSQKNDIQPQQNKEPQPEPEEQEDEDIVAPDEDDDDDGNDQTQDDKPETPTKQPEQKKDEKKSDEKAKITDRLKSFAGKNKQAVTEFVSKSISKPDDNKAQEPQPEQEPQDDNQDDQQEPEDEQDE